VAWWRGGDWWGWLDERGRAWALAEVAGGVVEGWLISPPVLVRIHLLDKHLWASTCPPTRPPSHTSAPLRPTLAPSSPTFLPLCPTLTHYAACLSPLTGVVVLAGAWRLEAFSGERLAALGAVLWAACAASLPLTYLAHHAFAVSHYTVGLQKS
jgi:hypothetical protein